MNRSSTYRLKLLRVAMVAAMTVTGLGFAAAPAQAASPACNDSVRRIEKHIYNQGGIAATLWTQLPSASGNLNCTLRYGAHNWSVVVLQIALNDCYLRTPIAVDGIYGPKTRDVVKWFQAEHGITADGVYGPVTAAVMTWGFRYNGLDIDDRRSECWYWY